MAVDNNFSDPASYLYDRCFEWDVVPVHEILEESQLVEENDCGMLRHVHLTHTGRFILQQVYNAAEETRCDLMFTCPALII